MILQEVTLQPMDLLRHHVLLLVLLPSLAAVLAGCFSVPKSFIPNSPALRHLRYAFQDTLYTSCHATDLLETVVIHAVAYTYISYTEIYLLKTIYRHSL